jgi:hypothetical protein
MSWTFDPHAAFTRVQALLVTSMPAAAKVKVECTGRGCPFRARTASSRRCKGKRCKKTKGITSRDLTSLLRGAKLKPGARLTVAILQTNRVGKVYVFGIRARHQPTTQISCLAPGSSVLGRDCP